MRQTRFWLILLLMFFAVACAGAFAQANSSVTGIITDQTGAAVPDARITLTDPATGAIKSTITSGTGLYTIGGLNAANYSMKVSAKGFQTIVRNGVVVNISGVFRVDLKMLVGSETQTVTVEADALAVQSDSNVVSTLINEQQITELATNGRNIVGLAAMGLGVSSNLPDMNSPTPVGANFAISFNGLNQAHNIWIIDGGEAYDRGSGGKMSLMPSQDALGEFQVMGSNYPPDYGISSGGTVTMSIKSGTQKFHGEAWEFVRNDSLQAYNYFASNPQTGAVTAKPELRYNVFGANVGGPVFIPHVYNDSRKKTFFFYNEEWRKEVNGNPPNAIKTVPAGNNPTTPTTFTYKIPAFNNPMQTTVYVPTVSDPVFNAKLSAAGLTPGQPFPGNVIPGNLLDSNALLFNASKNMPVATTSNDTYVPSSGKLPTNVREDLFRIDHNINDKWQLMGHFIHDAVDQSYATVLWNSDNYPTVGSNFSNPSYGSVIKLTGTLAPDVLLEAAFNYDGNKIVITPVAAGGASFAKPSGWGAQSYFAAANNALNRLPNLTFSTFGTTWGPGNDPWKNGAEDYAENVSLSITKGRHALKFGLGYNRYTKNQIIGSSTEGTYTFNDGWNTTTNSPSGVLTGDSYLDFLLGFATTYAQAQTDPVNHYVNNTISVFAMDNWHVNSRLSLQFGLRYDALPHVWERNNQISNFEPSLYQTALAPQFTSAGAFAANSPGLQTFVSQGIATSYYMNGVVIAGQSGVPRGMVKNDYATYQPRVGFSYDLLGTGKTILRGGFGTFFERLQGNDIYNIAGNAPFVNSPSASNVELTNTSFNWQTGGLATSPRFPAAPTIISTRYPPPAVAQYSIGVQHEILPALIWVSQYVGNLAWHQNINLPINNYPLSTPLATRQQAANGSLDTVTGLLSHAYPGYGNLHQETNLSTGSYNSFQTGIRQQNRHGLSFEVDYTWSHEIDDQVGSSDLNTISNPWNLKYDRGSGSLDRRNMFSANYVYKIPLYAQGSGLAHTLLGGWEISGTIVSQSGLPWAGINTPGSGYADTIGLGGDYTNRASIIPGQKIRYPKTRDSKNVYQWVSGNAFMKPLEAWNGGTNLGFGNVGRDAIVGPGRTNFSTSLYKSFAIRELMHVELRADTFNTFNHTQFASGSAAGNINLTTSNATFGEVTGAADPRTWEFGGKFVF